MAVTLQGSYSSHSSAGIATRLDRYAGLTGTDLLVWTPFDISKYGFASAVRYVVNYDCIALATTDTTATYLNHFSGKVILTWRPSDGLGTVVKSYVFFNEGTDVNFVGPQILSGNLNINASAQATIRTFTLCMAAEIVAWTTVPFTS